MLTLGGLPVQRPGRRMVGGVMSLLVGLVVLSAGRAIAAPNVSSALYVDLDPQGGGYTISLPDGAPWHTYSTSDTATFDAQTLDDASGNPHGFWVSDGSWIVTYWQDEGTPAPGTFEVPEPGDQLSCGAICVTVGAAWGNNCRGSGQITIAAIDIAQDGTIETIDADFDLHCFSGVMAGSIRYHSDRPVTAMLQTADVLAYGLTDLGQTSAAKTITFTSAGENANHLGTVTLGGTDATSFEITADTCSGATLETGESCDVSVAFKPTVRGNRFATLTFTDGTIAGSRRVKLLGAGLQHSTVTIAPGSIPTYGPATGTFMLTVDPPAGGPALFIDGAQNFGPASSEVTEGQPQVWTYTVTLQPGHHVVTAELLAGDFVAAAVAEPVEVDVGVKTSITLSTATDDGVATGESATLRARLDAGAPLDSGTIRILDGATDDVLAEGTPSGTISFLEHVLPEVTGSHGYRVEYVPGDVSVQAAEAAYELASVPGPRPETFMTSEPLWSNTGAVTLDGFSSADAGATFQCRVDVSDWFACASPVIMNAQPYATHTVSVRAVLPNGLADRTPAVRDWRIDDTPPTATAPETRSILGQGTGGAVAPVQVSWTGSDGESGVDHYLLSVSTDGAAWTSLGTSSAASRTTALRTGHSYRFRIRPVDRAGNLGAIRVGPQVTLTAVQDGSPRILLRGSWTRSVSSAWWGGTSRSSSKAGATATLTFTGRSISWVGSKGPTRGFARVYVNGVLKAVVNLYAASATNRMVVWRANFASSATRTITIKVVGTPGHGRVDVDGFVIAR